MKEQAGLKLGEAFNAEGLNVPFFPEEFEGRVEQVSEYEFGTRSSETSMYDVEAFIEEAVTKDVEDYVMMGFAGHGMGSQGVHYYLVKGPLMLFIQQTWGGVVVDVEEEKERFEGLMDGVKMLLDAVEKAEAEGLIKKGKRLLVLESDMYGSGWTWIEGRPGRIEEDAWNIVEPVFLSAMLAVPSKD